jgi:hypothetical protein
MIRCADPWSLCDRPALARFRSADKAPGFSYTVELCALHLKEHCGDFAHEGFTVVQLASSG